MAIDHPAYAPRTSVDCSTSARCGSANLLVERARTAGYVRLVAAVPLALPEAGVLSRVRYISPSHYPRGRVGLDKTLIKVGE